MGTGTFITVTHSLERPACETQMDLANLEPFGGIEEDDEKRIEWSGYRCRCHGWEVQRSLHVTKKQPFELFGALTEIQ